MSDREIREAERAFQADPTDSAAKRRVQTLWLRARRWRHPRIVPSLALLREGVGEWVLGLANEVAQEALSTDEWVYRRGRQGDVLAVVVASTLGHSVAWSSDQKFAPSLPEGPHDKGLSWERVFDFVVHRGGQATVSREEFASSPRISSTGRRLTWASYVSAPRQSLRAAASRALEARATRVQR